MHPMIAQRAFETLPESMKAELRPHVPTILWGSTVPDLLWQDWENHVWDVHGRTGAQGRGPEKIAELLSSLERMLADDPRDLNEIAFHMGILSHYISDLNQPLHTDDYAPAEVWVHGIYEEDAWIHEHEVPIEFRGFSLYTDPYSSARSEAERANHYYEAIIRAYTEGNGFESARG
ncbi:MAG: zinc dependent phospholipase C family protein [Deltaproteobacteria bacterium]